MAETRAEDLLTALAPVLTRWTMGGSAAALAPAPWRSALGPDAGADKADAELHLLAFTGQLLGALSVAEPAGTVDMRPDIPLLAKPPLEPSLRPRARRLLTVLREADKRRALLALLDRRGWTMHPADWMPGVNEADLPEVYSPWQDWVGQADPLGPDFEADLSAESWDQFGPAARRVAFAALRRRDPAQAAALLAQMIGSETPDRRLLFLDLLAAGLTPADAPVLEAVANDRAPRVKARAAALLARLGHGDTESEDTAELAGFFTVKTKGWLRKSLEIVPQNLKTPAQRNRRAALMDTLTFSAMARALDLAPEELVAAWPWGGDAQTDHALAAMIERSAADALVRLAADTMIAGPTIDLHALSPLLPRLEADWRRQLALRVLDANGGAFWQALDIAGQDGELDGVTATAAGKALIGSLAGSSDARSSEDLIAFGLLASAAEAARVLETLARAGLMASDPRLDMLRLNAALHSEGTRP